MGSTPAIVYGTLDPMGGAINYLSLVVALVKARLRIPAGFLQDSFIFLLERFQLKERRSFCEGTLKKSRTDREGTAGTSFLF